MWHSTQSSRFFVLDPDLGFMWHHKQVFFVLAPGPDWEGWRALLTKKNKLRLLSVLSDLTHRDAQLVDKSISSFPTLTFKLWRGFDKIASFYDWLLLGCCIRKRWSWQQPVFDFHLAFTKQFAPVFPINSHFIYAYLSCTAAPYMYWENTKLSLYHQI